MQRDALELAADSPGRCAFVRCAPESAIEAVCAGKFWSESATIVSEILEIGPVAEDSLVYRGRVLRDIVLFDHAATREVSANLPVVVIEVDDLAVLVDELVGAER